MVVEVAVGGTGGVVGAATEISGEIVRDDRSRLNSLIFNLSIWKNN